VNNQNIDVFERKINGGLRQGQRYVAEWMNQHCRLNFIKVKDDGDDSSSLGACLSGFTRFLSETGSGTAPTSAGWRIKSVKFLMSRFFKIEATTEQI